MITTTATSQTEILKRISQLYLGGGPYQADLTYGSGGFWKELLPPLLRFDIDPQFDFVQAADIRALPLSDGVLSSAVVDLPFIHAHGKDSVIGRRFQSVPSQRALDDLHHAAAGELSRVMAPGGIVVWKTQDIIESGKPVWNHIRIHWHCGQRDLWAEDLFVLVKKSAMTGWNHAHQQHARRTHSYFWVFKKAKK